MYLPREDLERFGCEVRGGRIEGPAELLVAFEAERGLGFVDRGLALVPLLDRRSAACVLAMAGAYRPAARADRGGPALVLEGGRRSAVGEGLVLARSLGEGGMT